MLVKLAVAIPLFAFPLVTRSSWYHWLKSQATANHPAAAKLIVMLTAPSLFNAV